MKTFLKYAGVIGVAGVMALAATSPSQARDGRNAAAIGGFVAGAAIGAAAANANNGYYYNRGYAYEPGYVYDGGPYAYEPAPTYYGGPAAAPTYYSGPGYVDSGYYNRSTQNRCMTSRDTYKNNDSLTTCY